MVTYGKGYGYAWQCQKILPGNIYGTILLKVWPHTYMGPFKKYVCIEIGRSTAQGTCREPLWSLIGSLACRQKGLETKLEMKYEQWNGLQNKKLSTQVLYGSCVYRHSTIYTNSYYHIGERFFSNPNVQCEALCIVSVYHCIYYS